MFGEGRDMEQYRNSIQRLLDMQSLFDSIYPSHHRLPVPPDILGVLLEGAEKALKSELTGEAMELHGGTVRFCDMGGAAFYLPE